MKREPVVKETLETLPEVLELQARFQTVRQFGVDEPYFRTTPVELNFSSYDYLGLANHSAVKRASIQAIERYGCSASASRLVGGELELHRELEDELAGFLGTEACLVMVSGHATNVSLLSHLCHARDLIIYDERAHNSAIRGALASGAKRAHFRHNDLDELERVLVKLDRERFRRVLIWVEGLYSMDGDSPNLAHLLELQEKYRCLLMVDEAHSLGVLGDTGRGLAEASSLNRPGDIIWMGTLSKTLASCGGYIAGSTAFIRYLKHSLPSFVYSVGITPANAAAALEALRLLKREPQRVSVLQSRARFLKEELNRQGFDTGNSIGAVIPVLLGEAERALLISQNMRKGGAHVSAIVPPAVSAGEARLRFFVRTEHSEQDLLKVVQLLKLAALAPVSDGSESDAPL